MATSTPPAGCSASTSITGAPAGGSGDQYFIGKFDGSHFTEDHPGSGAHWADWGADFYASTSFSNLPPDHDPIWIAWMDNWKYARKLPSLPGRGQMTSARSLYLREPPAHPAPTPGQEPLQLVQHPILPIPDFKPYAAMFGAPIFQSIAEANAHLAKDKAPGSVYVVRFDIYPGEAAQAGIRLRRSTNHPNEPRRKKPSSASTRKRDRSFSIAPTPAKRIGLPISPRAWPPRSSIRRKPQSTSRSSWTKTPSKSLPTMAKPSSPASSIPSESSQGLSFFASPLPPGFDPAQIRDIQLFPLEQPAAK